MSGSDPFDRYDRSSRANRDVGDRGRQGPNRPDPLNRRPTRLSATIAIVGALAVGSALVLTVGIPVGFVAGIVAAGLLTWSFARISSGSRRRRIGSRIALFLGSLALIAATGLSLANTHQGWSADVTVGAVFGVVAVTVDLTVGLDRDVRSSVLGAVGQAIVPFALVFALAFTARAAFLPLRSSLLTRYLTAVARVEFGLLSFSYLIVPVLATLVVGTYLRVTVPPTAAPGYLRPVFDANWADVKQRFIWLAFCAGAVSIGTNTVGRHVREPIGYGETGTTVHSVTETMVATAMAIGSTPRYHLGAFVALGGAVAIAVGYRYWRWAVDRPGRLDTTLACLPWFIVVGTLALATDVFPTVVEPSLERFVDDNYDFTFLLDWYLAVGGPEFTIVALYATVVLLALLLYGVVILERLRIVPANESGLALGTASLAVATVAVVPVTAPPLLVFLAVGGVLSVWDVGHSAIELGQILGRDADTKRTELLSAVTTVVVVLGATGVTFLLSRTVSEYRLAGGRVQLVFGLVLSAAGMIALLFSLRD